MSKSGGTTRSLASSGPPSFQQPHINTLMSEANRLYQSPGPTFFPGSTVAGFAPAELEASRFLQGSAAPRTDEIGNLGLDAFKFGTKTALDVDNNPYLQKSITAATRPIFDQLTESVLPTYRRGFEAGGSYGGSRQGIAEGLALSRATRDAMDVGAQMSNAAYNTGLGTFASTLNQLGNVQQAQVMPGQILSAVGAQERDMAQAQIDEQIARHTYEQNLPYTKLTEFGNLISRPFGGTSESTVVSPETGRVEQIAGSVSALLPLIGQLLRVIGG